MDQTITEQFEKIKEEMCDHYCKYVADWDEDDGDIWDSPICDECPMNKL